MKKIYPYALISFIIGLLSFVQLLGFERAVLAVVFGSIALREMNRDRQLAGRKFAYLGLALGLLYILTVSAMFFIKGTEIMSFLM